MTSEDLFINSRISIPHWELSFSASRSAGPGGQHANKTSSRVTLHWSVPNTSALSAAQKIRVIRKLGKRLTSDGVLLINVEEFRSQHRNKEIAIQRLQEILIEALKVQKRRKPTKPSKAAKRKRVDEKKSRGTLKKITTKTNTGIILT